MHGLWHLPLFFVAGTVQHAWGFTAVEFALFVAAVMGGAVIYTWLHLASGGSVWAATLFHTTSNLGMSFLWTLYDGGTSDRLVMALAIAVLATFLVRVVGPSGSGPRRRPWLGLGPAAP